MLRPCGITLPFSFSCTHRLVLVELNDLDTPANQILFLRDVTKIDQSKNAQNDVTSIQPMKCAIFSGKTEPRLRSTHSTAKSAQCKLILQDQWRSEGAKLSLNNRRSIDLIANPQPRSNKNEILTAYPPQSSLASWTWCLDGNPLPSTTRLPPPQAHIDRSSNEESSWTFSTAHLESSSVSGCFWW